MPVELTPADIAAIDAAGAKGETGNGERNFVRRIAVLALIASLVLGTCSYLKIDVI